MPRLLVTLLALVLALSLAPVAPADAVRADGVGTREGPTREQWISDVSSVMAGSHGQIRQRVAERAPHERLAVNFDIDNTVIATYFDGGGAIARMLSFARFLERQDVAVLFNTGRVVSMRRTTKRQLVRNGYPVDGLCLRGQGKTLPFGKQRCRDRFAADGYTLIANVGNNKTDFMGDGFERSYVLPNYGGLLG